MADLPKLVRPCLNEAVARASRLAERAAEHAAAALDQEAVARTGPVDWREVQAAGRELLRLRAVWRDSFPPQLRALLEQPPKSRPAGDPPPRFSSLALVDDDEVTQAVESARLAQELMPKVEQALAELDPLMSAALGLDAVHPELNPLRPEVFAIALRRLIARSEMPSPAWPALWMRHLAEPVSHDLVHLYRAASKLLTQAGVQPAGYRLVTAPAPLEPASAPMPLDGGRGAAGLSVVATGAPAARGAGAPAHGGPVFSVATLSQWLHSAVAALRGPVLRDFLRGGSAARALPVHEPLAPTYYARVEEELAALEARQDEPAPDADDGRHHAHLPPVDRPARLLGTESALSTDRWGAFAAPRQRSLVRTRLKQQAQQVGQALGLEVVRQLVDEVAQDPRLLAPVREAIVALEPALARQAMHAPQFFGDEQHPARRLLEGVAARSFRYNDEFGPDFQSFFEPVRTAFNALNRIDSLQDPQAFREALDELEAAWGAQDREQERGREQVLEAMQFAERRQAEAEQIAWELSHRSDLEGTPAVVQDFLFGSWALVIAHARLRAQGNELDPGGYLAVVPELLWTAKREETLREPARAFETIPGVLTRLRSGLDLLGQPAAENDSFFGALEKLHRPVLKLRAKHRKQAWQPSTLDEPLGQDLAPATSRKPRPTEELWLAPGELQVCGFADTVPSDYAPLRPLEDFPPSQPPAGQMADSAVDAMVAGLREGAWVDLYSRQKWHRAQLVWAGTRGTLFMFVSEGRQPHSMSRRSLQRLLAERLLRPVDTGEVVQQALDALAQPQPQAIAA
jgi:hypothetical protein